VETCIISCDYHIPFYDDKSLSELLSFTQKNIPNKFIIAGDFCDLYSISKYDSAPTRADELEYELTIAREILQKIRAISSSMGIIFIVGNHEQRLEKFLSRGKNKALYNLACLKLENLLNFSKYNITKVENIYRLNENFIITHGSKCGLNAAQSEALSYMTNGASGHTHRELTFKRKFLDKTIEWHSIPCMCNITDAKYAEKFNHAWSNGFAHMSYDEKAFEIKIIRTN
jgi:hypothetical protein